MVDWQSESGLDSIRNSCNVFSGEHPSPIKTFSIKAILQWKLQYSVITKPLLTNATAHWKDKLVWHQPHLHFCHTTLTPKQVLPVFDLPAPLQFRCMSFYRAGCLKTSCKVHVIKLTKDEDVVNCLDLWWNAFKFPERFLFLGGGCLWWQGKWSGRAMTSADDWLVIVAAVLAGPSSAMSFNIVPGSAVLAGLST